MRTPMILNVALIALAVSAAPIAAYGEDPRFAAAQEDAVLTESQTQANEELNRPTTPVAVPKPIPPVVEESNTDFNHDGQTNMDDLVILLANWGNCPAADAVCAGDTNGDGYVNEGDLLFLMRAINLAASL